MGEGWIGIWSWGLGAKRGGRVLRPPPPPAPQPPRIQPSLSPHHQSHHHNHQWSSSSQSQHPTWLIFWWWFVSRGGGMERNYCLWTILTKRQSLPKLPHHSNHKSPEKNRHTTHPHQHHPYHNQDPSRSNPSVMVLIQMVWVGEGGEGSKAQPPHPLQQPPLYPIIIKPHRDLRSQSLSQSVFDRWPYNDYNL